jgi:dipeptidyl aminopeptidase/acylaminoacyl peptidase
VPESLYAWVQSAIGDGSEDAIADASPIVHVSRSAPPFVTRVGAEDTVTTPAMCEAFHRTLDEAGVPNCLQIVPGHGHGIPLHDHAGCVRATIDFLGRYL